MIQVGIIVLAVSAVLGLILATVILRDKETPKSIVLTHGTLSATGLVLLIIYALENPDHYIQVSLIIFVLAAIGGFYLFVNDMNKKPGPKSVVIIHGLAAVVAFALLLFVVIG